MTGFRSGGRAFTLTCCISILVNVPAFPQQGVIPPTAAHGTRAVKAETLTATAVPGLIKALGDPQAGVREAAALALGKIGPAAADAIPALVRALADNDPYVAGRASAALGKIGPAAVPPLTRALDDSNASVRFSTAIALSNIPGVAPLPALRHALSDPDPRVRWTAVLAMGSRGPSAGAAVPALVGLLSDRDEDVRIGAVAALERISPGWTGGDRRTIVAVIDSLVPRLMEELHVPGVSVALILDREIAWSGAFGHADAVRKVPVRSNTLFEACSMSKPIFAYIVLKLVEEGVIGLDEPLSHYVQSVESDLRPITARMVLSHTSGLPNWRRGDEEREGPLTLAFTPGARFSYSGEGIFFLQRAIEEITGEPLDVFAARRLFRPMGLGSCSYIWIDSLDSRIAAGHDDRGGFLQKTAYVHPNAAYSLYVSAEDYARLLLELVKDDRSAPCSLSRRSVDTMLSRQVRLDSREPIVRPGRARGTGVYWGLGWSINSTPDGDIAHHSGANRSGFRCFSQFSRARGTGIVIFTNSTSGGELWARVISRVGDL
jgi:CubicO group peptidase (beta-lactamase class C family)